MFLLNTLTVKTIPPGGTRRRKMGNLLPLKLERKEAWQSLSHALVQLFVLFSESETTRLFPGKFSGLFSPPGPDPEQTWAPKKTPSEKSPAPRQLKGKREILAHILHLSNNAWQSGCLWRRDHGNKRAGTLLKNPQRGFKAASGHAFLSCRASVTTAQCQDDACLFFRGCTRAQSYMGYLPLISGADRRDDGNLIAVFEWHISWRE